MAYVYRHIRLDKNIPFYIGIGNDNKGKYTRAYFKSNRNIHWKNIVKGCPYEVEILLDDITWEEACKKEIEFIKLYGRSDLWEGCLVNKTDGGEGCLNGITSETRAKMAAKLRGRPLPDWVKLKFREAKLGKKAPYCHKAIYQFNVKGELIGEFENISLAAKKLGLQSANIGACLKNRRTHCGGYLFAYKKNYTESNIIKTSNLISEREIIIYGRGGSRKIKNKQTGTIYNSLIECAIKEQIPRGTISCWMNRKNFNRFEYV